MNSAAWTLAAFLLVALFLVSLSLIGRCRDAKKDREADAKFWQLYAQHEARAEQEAAMAEWHAGAEF